MRAGISLWPSSTMILGDIKLGPAVSKTPTPYIHLPGQGAFYLARYYLVLLVCSDGRQKHWTEGGRQHGQCMVRHGYPLRAIFFDVVTVSLLTH